MQQAERLTGRVKTWIANRAFGFIETPDARSFFAHVSQVQGDWEPMKGDEVEFSPDLDKSGRPFARKIVIVKGDER
jgi:cold shock CspA family protein